MNADNSIVVSTRTTSWYPRPPADLLFADIANWKHIPSWSIYLLYGEYLSTPLHTHSVAAAKCGVFMCIWVNELSLAVTRSWMIYTRPPPYSYQATPLEPNDLYQVDPISITELNAAAAWWTIYATLSRSHQAWTMHTTSTHKGPKLIRIVAP